MMNFNPGFYEEMRAMSSSSSSSSSLHHRGGPQLPESSPADNNNIDNDDLLLLGHRGAGGSNTSTPPVEREHMFDKVVTPSDVGKLNRLVIPKQHAEKYFPLDSSTNEKGLLLNFEDRNGKPWRFRYSYWNSSQSYVMTKGWSRFVKEKKLDAGDIVSFQRGVGELGKDRLFIDWRRRPDAPDHHFPPPHHMLSSIPHHHHFSSFQRSSSSSSYAQPWNPLYLQQASHLLQSSSTNYHHHNQYHPYGGGPNYTYSTVVNGNPCPPGSIVYLRSAAPQVGGGVLPGGSQEQVGMVHSTTSGVEQMVFDSVPVVQGKAAAKRLRLFGVNMDCPINSSESDECDILSSSTTLPHQTIPFHHLPPPNSNSSLQLRPYIDNHSEEKGKGSMSLDLDI